MLKVNAIESMPTKSQGIAKSQSDQIYFSTEFFCLATKLWKSADYVALYPVTMKVITLQNQSWPHGSSSKDFLIKATLL